MDGHSERHVRSHRASHWPLCIGLLSVYPENVKLCRGMLLPLVAITSQIQLSKYSLIVMPTWFGKPS